MSSGKFTQQEILSQPQAWEETIAILQDVRQDILDLHPENTYNNILFTGCGSTYYLSLSAAALTQQLTGISCQAFPASELWLNPRSSYTDCKSLLVAISRSGETTETLNACQAFIQKTRGDLLTLSCYPQMPLAKMGNLNLVFPSGQEQSVAQTRAFTILLLAATALASLWSGRMDLFDSLSSLPEAGQRVIDQAATLAAVVGRDASIDRFYWLGSGPRYGLAAELSLKMKEMSLSHSEPFHFMEFRHGPKSMITTSSLVIGLQSLTNEQHESAVLSDAMHLGARIIDIAEDGSKIKLGQGLDEAVSNILYLPAGQLIAFEHSIFKGLDPDLPTNLDSVVKL